MSPALYEYLVSVVPKENILENEPMSKHTTFKVGGEASCFVKVQTKEQLAQIVKYLNLVEREYYILGNGSNLLVGDKGYEGVMIDMTEMNKIKVEGNRMIAQAGAKLPNVAKIACDNSLSGLEFAAGIPGTVGGATVMNAGAYEGEMKQVVKNVTVVSTQGEELVFDNETMEFSYRHSCIKDTSFVVVEVEFELKPGNPEEIKATMDDFNGRRRDKQPLNYASAGSTFKRPEGHFAGKLIMDAGLRGYRIGGAQVSEKHCGFIINDGTACAADIKDLMDEVTRIVKQKMNVELEPEVILIGEF
ncbi:MAG: UDP-N-acetylmuramate dehydrogenase [Lachnospiraceae bacterium]|nr:UDP-N-acetylmuramate dehydrogenase [Lachnospiraceae bacterium]